MALGIGGVILVAEAATTLAHGVFGDGCGGLGRYDGDEAAFEGGYEAGDRHDQQNWGHGGGWRGFDDGEDWGGGDFAGGDAGW